MYELLVLALLMDYPLHAYLMADIANAIIGPWERISRGTLSTLVARLDREGLIAAADPATVPFPSQRASTAWAITPAGRERFIRLMLDTTANLGIYIRLFRIKALHLHLLAREERLMLVEHYLAYCQTGLRYTHAQARDMAENPMKRRLTPQELRHVALDLMRLQTEQWELEIAWARGLRQSIVDTNDDGQQRVTSAPEKKG